MPDHDVNLTQVLMTFGQDIAAIKQRQSDMMEQVFGGNGRVGMLPYLASVDKTQGEQLSALKELVMNQKVIIDNENGKAHGELRDMITTEKTERKVSRAYTIGWSAGAGFVGALVLKIIPTLKGLFGH